MTPTTPTRRAESIHPPTARPSRGAHVGDLARRVTHRRHELGLSTTDLARQAGVDPWFLAYFEQSSDTTLSAGAMLRLAVVLQTTRLALEGGLVDEALGVDGAGGHPWLETLTSDRCKEHLAAGGIGRIVLSTGSGPIALPVNFAFACGSIIFRTSGAVAGQITGIVAFEVDEATTGGWSVLVRGRARLIEDPSELLAASHLELEPWAGGDLPHLVSIAPFAFTGRVIVGVRGS